jgi:hypothetical protein
MHLLPAHFFANMTMCRKLRKNPAFVHICTIVVKNSRKVVIEYTMAVNMRLNKLRSKNRIRLDFFAITLAAGRLVTIP